MVSQRSLVVLLLLVVVARVVALSVFHEDLTDDRDAYLGIARGLSDGRGYSGPESETPTAFRPPLYPLLISSFAQPEQRWFLASFHLLMSLATAWFILKTAQSLGLSARGQIVAVGIYAVDPLMVRYTALPMTETLCAMLCAWMLQRLTKPNHHPAFDGIVSGLTDALIVGLVFGLGVLCRPSLWAWGGLLVVSWLWFSRNRPSRQRLRCAATVITGVAVIVMPWFVRNCIVMESPILLTTHGGYTILLGNNESFYREVVQEPIGTVWDGSRGAGQQGWVNELNHEMEQAGITGEVERDRFMAVRARETIARHPRLFLQSCLLRELRFWNVVPSGPAAAGLPSSVLWGMAIFYSALWCGLLWGTVGSATDRATWERWYPVYTLIIAFAIVHALYWSNVRMRAPIVPAIAVVVASLFSRPRKTATTGTTDR